MPKKKVILYLIFVVANKAFKIENILSNKNLTNNTPNQMTSLSEMTKNSTITIGGSSNLANLTADSSALSMYHASFQHAQQLHFYQYLTQSMRQTQFNHPPNHYQQQNSHQHHQHP